MICRLYRVNLQLGATLLMMLYATAAIASSAISVPLPFFNVPLTVLAMAGAGSLVGFAYAPPVESRKKLYTYALSNTLIASWLVVLIPEWRSWTVSEVALPPLAGMIAAASVVIVPIAFKRLPEVFTLLLDRYFKKAPGGEQ